jgi:hypothetical protein
MWKNPEVCGQLLKALINMKLAETLKVVSQGVSTTCTGMAA